MSVLKNDNSSSKYSTLSRAELACEYLHANSTTHEFLFGALAELVDNARDANAKNLQIYSEKFPELRGGFTLNFLDDGEGMSPEEAENLITFGRSFKKASDLNLIGQYGNGFKSGSMRIGQDVILFTKKNSIYTIVFLSRTFLEFEKLNKIIIAVPSFNAVNKSPYYNISDYEIAREKHRVEMELILKYSPFKTMVELNEQLDRIEGDSGTLVVVYNLRLLDDGQTELDITSDPHDIQMTNFLVDYDRKSQMEHKSFRAYVAILYLDPKMKVYIQNRKVRTKLYDQVLYEPRMYKYISNRFKNRAIAEKLEAERKLGIAKDRLREMESRLADFSKKYNAKIRDEVIELTVRKRARDNAAQDVESEKLNLERKIKAINEPKALNFIFGLNIHNRMADGLFIYNCNRLILMFEHTKQQKASKEYLGIVGIVNVPYLVLEPTHNKQHFADSQEQKQLINALGEKMDQYVKDLQMKLNGDFWRRFGYFDDERELPSNEEGFLRRRLQTTNTMAQCDSCLKWRHLSWNKRLLEAGYPPENWTCTDNMEVGRDTCRATEVIAKIKPGEMISASEAETKSIGQKKQSNSAANKVYATLFQKQNNVVVEKAVPKAAVADERSKKRVNYSQNSDSEDDLNDKDDPDFKLNKKSRKNLKKNTTKNYDETAEKIVIDRPRSSTEYIIENERVDDDYFVKDEPNSQDLDLANGTSETFSALSCASRAMEENGALLSSNSEHVNNAYLKTLRVVLTNYRSLLKQLAIKSNDPMLINLTSQISDEDLANFPVNDFMRRYRDLFMQNEAKILKRKIEKIREKLKAVLLIEIGEIKTEEILEEIE